MNHKKVNKRFHLFILIALKCKMHVIMYYLTSEINFQQEEYDNSDRMNESLYNFILCIVDFQ